MMVRVTVAWLVGSVSAQLLPYSPWPMKGGNAAHSGRALLTGSDNGVSVCTYDTGGGVKSSPAIAGDGTVVVASESGYLYALNPDCSLKWRYSTGNVVKMSSPTIDANGVIYVGSSDMGLHAVTSTGTRKWRYATGGSTADSSPCLDAKGVVYVCSTDGKVYLRRCRC